jgi:hypothetical protein
MKRTKFEEIWVNRDDGQALCALINADRGWLMYTREPGDGGFSSRNPDYDGADEDQIEYYLNNGQRDEYPASWALPVDLVRRALDHFKKTGAPPAFITWHNDSGDGTVLGAARPRAKARAKKRKPKRR